MAAGIPVLMTDVGCAGDVLKDGENGMVVRVNDPSAFLNALIKIYRDPDLRRRLAGEGRKTVESLEFVTRDRYAFQYAEILSHCATYQDTAQK